MANMEMLVSGRLASPEARVARDAAVAAAAAAPPPVKGNPSSRVRKLRADLRKATQDNEGWYVLQPAKDLQQAGARAAALYQLEAAVEWDDDWHGSREPDKFRTECLWQVALSGHPFWPDLYEAMMNFLDTKA